MNRITIFCGMAWLAISSIACAGDTNLVVVRTIGSVNRELGSRILSWVSGSISQATDGGAFVTSETNLEAIATAVSQAQTNKAQLVLVLAGQCRAADQARVLTNGVAVVNLNALKLVDLTKPAARETYERRIEKESVSGLATLLSMPPCPFPQCALYQHENVEALDAKGRNLCPPCTEKLQEVVGKRK